jgi:hypothetical protein
MRTQDLAGVLWVTVMFAAPASADPVSFNTSDPDLISALTTKVGRVRRE